MKKPNERPVQYFTKEYLERSKLLSMDEIVEFLENYRMLMNDQQEKCVGISLKIEPRLLHAFKTKAKLNGLSYQTQIKKLMRDWILES